MLGGVRVRPRRARGPAGVSFGGLPPERLALTLDGRPADDLFTGRPALERLPEGLLAPLRAARGRFGALHAIAAETRAFEAAVPITELLYRTGPGGVQTIGATHAQTRRPGFVRGLGGDQARLGALFHVGAQSAGGLYTNAGFSAWQAIGRVGLALPGLAVEVTERYGSRTEGAWGGIAPGASPDPFAATAPVRLPEGERTLTQNDLSVALRRPLLPRAEPLAVTAFWTAATYRYRVGADTSEAGAHRYGLGAEQSLALGGHRLRARVDAWAGRATSGLALPADGSPYPPEVHALLEDALTLEGFDVTLALGLHAAPEVFPSARAEVGRAFGPLALRVGAHYGGARLAPVERLGFGGVLAAEPYRTERLSAVFALAEVALGPVTLRASGTASEQRDPRLLLLAEGEDPARFVTAEGSFRRAQATVGLALRESATRGLYVEAEASAHRLLNPEASALHRREAGALPEAWGRGRLGVRGRALFGGALDLDVYARARAWTAFRGRGLHPETALLGLPSETAPLVPARPVLDLVAEAGLWRGRAVAFVAYENALAGLAYDGAYVVPVYPLLPPGLRLGLFWVLPD
jgi:hypothetical protein